MAGKEQLWGLSPHQLLLLSQLPLQDPRAENVEQTRMESMQGRSRSLRRHPGLSAKWTFH